MVDLDHERLDDVGANELEVRVSAVRKSQRSATVRGGFSMLRDIHYEWVEG